MDDNITINNIKYISVKKHDETIEELKKPVEKEKAKRFNEEQTIKLISTLSKLFQISSESVNEDYLIKNDVFIIDPANVCGVSGKTEEAKRLLTLFYDYETKSKTSPVLDHKSIEGEICKSRVSMEYTTKIIKVLDVTEEALSITTKHDYPTIFENKDFKFVLAPRIEDEK